MIAASVVVLPEPVAPVTSTSPRCSSAIDLTPGGILRSSKLGTCLGMTRNANDIEPRWRTALTRRRGGRRKPKRKTGEALESELQAPGDALERRERRREPLSVGVEIARPAVQELERRLCG